MTEHRKSITRELKILNNKIKRAADASIPKELKAEVTEMQCRILGFLTRRKEQDVFQRDVEAEFSITRATASKILTGMEHSGLIVRSGVEGDARLKKLELTKKADGIFSNMRESMTQFEASMTQTLTAKEQEILLSLLQKLEQNLNDLNEKRCGRA